MESHLLSAEPTQTVNYTKPTKEPMEVTERNETIPTNQKDKFCTEKWCFNCILTAFQFKTAIYRLLHYNKKFRLHYFALQKFGSHNIK